MLSSRIDSIKQSFQQCDALIVFLTLNLNGIICMHVCIDTYVYMYVYVRLYSSWEDLEVGTKFYILELGDRILTF